MANLFLGSIQAFLKLRKGNCSFKLHKDLSIEEFIKLFAEETAVTNQFHFFGKMENALKPLKTASADMP